MDDFQTFCDCKCHLQSDGIFLPFNIKNEQEPTIVKEEIVANDENLNSPVHSDMQTVEKCVSKSNNSRNRIMNDLREASESELNFVKQYFWPDCCPQDIDLPTEVHKWISASVVVQPVEELYKLDSQGSVHVNAKISCVSLERLEMEYKIKKNGSVQLVKQVVQPMYHDDTFVALKPMKANKKVPIIKPADRAQVFFLDEVKDLYCHRNRKFKCPKCDKYFSSKCSLRFHVRDKHDHVTKYSCKHCSRAFLSKSQFLVHVARHEKKKRVQCRKCLKRFYCVSDRNKHQATCFKIGTYKCQSCGAGFSTKETLRQHVLQKVSRRKYKCVNCKAKYYHYASLHRHVAQCVN